VIGYIVLALGLVLIVEGLAWVLAPSLLEKALAVLAELPVAARRQVGLIFAVMGFVCLWIAVALGV
jgi:uncharacterized protein YjeT (DUF2065 family)